MADEENGAKPKRKRQRPRVGSTVAAVKAEKPTTVAGAVIASVKDVVRKLKSRPGSKFK